MDTELDPRLTAAGFTFKGGLVAVGELPEGWKYDGGEPQTIVTDRGESIPLPSRSKLVIHAIFAAGPGKVGIEI